MIERTAMIEMTAENIGNAFRWGLLGGLSSYGLAIGLLVLVR